MPVPNLSLQKCKSGAYTNGAYRDLSNSPHPPLERGCGFRRTVDYFGPQVNYLFADRLELIVDIDLAACPLHGTIATG